MLIQKRIRRDKLDLQYINNCEYVVKATVTWLWNSRALTRTLRKAYKIWSLNSQPLKCRLLANLLFIVSFHLYSFEFSF